MIRDAMHNPIVTHNHLQDYLDELVTIQIQRQKFRKELESNWLLAHQGDFKPTIRFYNS